MNIFLKRCDKCGEGFDIGINYDLCPDCRKKIKAPTKIEWTLRFKKEEEDE